MINKGSKKIARRRERRKNKIDIFTVYYTDNKTGKVNSCPALIEKGEEEEEVYQFMLKEEKKNKRRMNRIRKYLERRKERKENINK